MITTSTLQISVSPARIVGAVRSRRLVRLRNADGSISIRVSGSSESLANDSDGYTLKPEESVEFRVGPGDDVWAVADSGAPLVQQLLSDL